MSYISAQLGLDQLGLIQLGQVKIHVGILDLTLSLNDSFTFTDSEVVVTPKVYPIISQLGSAQLGLIQLGQYKQTATHDTLLFNDAFTFLDSIKARTFSEEM